MMTENARERNEQSLATVADCIRGRRTITLFEDRLVPLDIVRQAIDVARWAPNHHVTEPWRFYVLGEGTRNALIELVRDVTSARKGKKAGDFKAGKWARIPGCLVVTTAVSTDEITRQEDYAACCCALQNMLLYLWQAGVGGKWSTGEVTRDPRFYELIGADRDKESVVGLVSYGYPAMVPQQRRKGADEVLSITD